MDSKKFSRNSFISKFGKGALITSIVSWLPIKFLFSKKNDNKKIDIKIHPSAVKRNNKV
jgi:hypothetical protein